MFSQTKPTCHNSRVRYNTIKTLLERKDQLLFHLGSDNNDQILLKELEDIISTLNIYMPNQNDEKNMDQEANQRLQRLLKTHVEIEQELKIETHMEMDHEMKLFESLCKGIEDQEMEMIKLLHEGMKEYELVRGNKQFNHLESLVKHMKMQKEWTINYQNNNKKLLQQNMEMERLQSNESWLQYQLQKQKTKISNYQQIESVLRQLHTVRKEKLLFLSNFMKYEGNLLYDTGLDDEYAEIMFDWAGRADLALK